MVDASRRMSVLLESAALDNSAFFLKATLVAKISFFGTFFPLGPNVKGYQLLTLGLLTFYQM